MTTRQLRRVLAAAGVGAVIVLAAPFTAAYAHQASTNGTACPASCPTQETQPPCPESCPTQETQPPCQRMENPCGTPTPSHSKESPSPPHVTPPGPPIAPFTNCVNQGFQVQRPKGQESTLGIFNPTTQMFEPIKNLGKQVNAIGYSTTQKVFWGMEVARIGKDQLIRIDSKGNVDLFGQPVENGKPLGITTDVGTVDKDLLYLETKQPNNRLLVINVNPSSPDFGKVQTDIPLSRATQGHSYLNIGDWDFNPADHMLYALEWVDGTTRDIVKINPQTGQVTTGLDLSTKIPDGQNFGADYFMADNVLFVSDNDVNRTHTENETFSINIVTGDVTAFRPAPIALQVNDGASCIVPAVGPTTPPTTPPTPVVGPSVSPVVPSASSSPLPVTGASTASLIASGMGLIGLGSIAVIVGRRRLRRD
jgi:hypothetical protein